MNFSIDDDEFVQPKYKLVNLLWWSLLSDLCAELNWNYRDKIKIISGSPFTFLFCPHFKPYLMYFTIPLQETRLF